MRVWMCDVYVYNHLHVRTCYYIIFFCIIIQISDMLLSSLYAIFLMSRAIAIVYAGIKVCKITKPASSSLYK